MPPAQAGSSTASAAYCDQPAPLSAGQHSRLLRVSALLAQALENSGHRAAIVSRSGLDLRWFGLRYSHAGISLKASTGSPWSVRQLYFACDEKLPRLFDQGLAAFVLGTENPALGYVSVLLLPDEGDAAAAVETLALDNRRALSLLGASYSANAYVYGLQYQNCNQWLAELLALAWGGREPASDGVSPRAEAQAWLAEQRFEGTAFALPWAPLRWLLELSPYLRLDDHPAAELAQSRLRVSMPESIEAFVIGRWPSAERLELCHTEEHAVLRRGSVPIADGCVPLPGDEVVSLR